MSEIKVITRDGETHTIEATSGSTLMELIRNSGIDELEALCGGSCSCATCHIYIDSATQEQIPPLSDGEDDLLDGSEYRNDESRLSCQLTYTETMDGITVTVAPEG